jgi:4-diphosphocytidyl-2-C-methyl-D-erythritol kinase
MTGSGSAVFAQLQQDAKIEEESAALRDSPDNWQLRECKNLSAHPLLGWALSDVYR